MAVAFDVPVTKDEITTDAQAEDWTTIKLSSKGQIVIPKKMRDELDLQTGAQFRASIQDDCIILQRIYDAETALEALDRLCGLLDGKKLLDDLEAEHRWEIERDERRIASIGS